MLKNSKFQGGFPPLTIFRGKTKIFKFFLVLKFSRQKMIRKLVYLFQNSRQKRMIPKVNFFKFENVSLKNSKCQRFFSPITIFQGKM
jgi:hypothetical protein